MPKLIDRDWIASELAKGFAAERTLAADARARAESPPAPTLSGLYHQMATDDDRHRLTFVVIAIRYGDNPTRDSGGGLGGTLRRLKGQVTELGPSPLDRLFHDLQDRVDSMDWCTTWIHTFQALGDAES